jgi:hypothetical protein
MPEQLLDNLYAGLVTSEQPEAEPYGYDVDWIHWDSGFRGTDLRVGDRVVGVNGTRYEVARRSKEAPRGVGGYAEPQFWADAQARDGSQATLTVYRDGELVEVIGTVRAERVYTDANGRRVIGPNGPPQSEREGFDSTWMTWLERFIKSASHVLGDAWRKSAFNSRQQLAEFVEQTNRVEHLVSKYPGPFATEMSADWKAVVESLSGTRYEVSDADLAYRSAGADASPAPAIVVRDDLTPAEVMQSLVTALELNAQPIWEGFFAIWSCDPTGDGRHTYVAGNGLPPQSLERLWTHARKMILTTVYDVRVARVGKTRVLLAGGETPGGPRVEAVTLEMDPVGLFEGEYRAFKDVNVHRMWDLQRVNDGPWRITSEHGI